MGGRNDGQLRVKHCTRGHRPRIIPATGACLLTYRIQRFVEASIPPSLQEPDAIRRARLTVWITITFQVIALVLAFVDIAIALHRPALLLAGFIAALGFVPVVLRRSATAAAHLLVSILWSAILLTASMRGRHEGPALVWMVMCPLAATLIAGPRAGAIWIAIVSLCAGSIPWLAEHYPWTGPIPQVHVGRAMNIISLSFGSYACALIYERARDHTFRLLRETNDSLAAKRAESELQLLEIAALNEQVAMEHRVAEKIVSKIVRRDASDPSYIQRIISPSQVFNGDMILVARTPTGCLRWMLGDFTGHGLVAAIGTIPASTIFYDGAAAGLNLAETIVRMNRALHELLPTGLFCASAVIELSADGKLAVWNGGLPSVLLIRDGAVVQRFESRQLALGIEARSEADVEIQEARLELGARIVTFSDGIPEMTDNQGAPLGLERAEQLLVAGVAELPGHLTTIRGQTPQSDDISVIEIRYDADFTSDCRAHEEAQRRRS